MKNLLVTVGVWAAVVTAVGLPPLLRVMPRGLVARCTSVCERGPRDDLGVRPTVAQATIELDDGRVLALAEGEFPCVASRKVAPRNPTWCVPVGGFVEKRRWELQLRTSEGRVGGSAAPVVVLFVSCLALAAAILVVRDEDRRRVARFARHPGGRWLSARLARAQARLHVPFLLAIIPALRQPFVIPLAGLAWLAAFALVGRVAVRGGSRRLLLISARRIARRRPGGAVLVGRLDGDALALRSGEVVVLDVASVVWLGDRPADGATVEVVAALQATGMEARRLVRSVVPLEDRPPLGRVLRTSARR